MFFFVKSWRWKFIEIHLLILNKIIFFYHWPLSLVQKDVNTFVLFNHHLLSMYTNLFCINFQTSIFAPIKTFLKVSMYSNRWEREKGREKLSNYQQKFLNNKRKRREIVNPVKLDVFCWLLISMFYACHTKYLYN